MKQLEVSAGILVYNEKILCTQRGQGKYDYISFKYEFPGGKIELGETPAKALQRELIEEMNLAISEDEMQFFLYNQSHLS